MLLHTDAVQARLAGRDPATAADLDVVLTSGRTALDDLHRLLRRAARDTGRRRARRTPGTLADVAPLVERRRRPGSTLAVDEDGRRVRCPRRWRRRAYRIVQESLYNVGANTPHQTGSGVELAGTPKGLRLEVGDDGGGRVRPAGRRGARAGRHPRAAGSVRRPGDRRPARRRAGLAGAAPSCPSRRRSRPAA